MDNKCDYCVQHELLAVVEKVKFYTLHLSLHFELCLMTVV